jgi:PEP-CTERM motif
MKTFQQTLAKLFMVIGVTAAAFLGHSNDAQAALISCGPVQIDSTAPCLISGTYGNTLGNPGGFTNGPTTVTLGGSLGNTSLATYNGLTLGTSVCGNPFQTAGTFGNTCSGLVATTTYLAFLFETSGSTRQFAVASASGALLLAGIPYQESTTQGVAKYDIYALPPKASVPVPASLALLGLGLAAFGLVRRK